MSVGVSVCVCEYLQSQKKSTLVSANRIIWIISVRINRMIKFGETLVDFF